jgi:dephospho-CoA kinase
MMSEKEINMITIGVTGGVGAGKSEILRHLKEHYNSRILMSDNAAKDLERPGGPLYEPLVALLESEEGRKGMAEPLLLPDKEINKAEMARRIFADAAILSKINQLVHPAVNQYILDEIERERKEGKREFFVLESALLLENGYDKILDSIDIVSLVAEISDTFDVAIPAEELLPENFNSAAALWELIQRLDEA